MGKKEIIPECFGHIISGNAYAENGCWDCKYKELCDEKRKGG